MMSIKSYSVIAESPVIATKKDYTPFRYPYRIVGSKSGACSSVGGLGHLPEPVRAGLVSHGIRGDTRGWAMARREPSAELESI